MKRSWGPFLSAETVIPSLGSVVDLRSHIFALIAARSLSTASFGRVELRCWDGATTADLPLHR